MAASVNQVLAQMQRWTAAARTAELSDAALLGRYVHERDQAAFAALVARHGALVWRVCRRILGNFQEAEDAFQGVFLILARKAASLKQPEALPGWLHGVARRVALKARTSAAARAGDVSFPEELPDSRPDPLAQLTARELLELIDEEIGRLPAAQRSAVILCCLEGHTREEAARILGCTSGAIKSHLQRGRQRLQKRLENRGITLSSALALVAVSQGDAAPALLMHSTVRAALGGGIGSTASALAHSVLKKMFVGKLAGVMAVTLTVALAASTTVALVYRGATAEAPEDKKPTVPAASKDVGAGKPQVRTDALGDPLPPGAIARLGTVRFRHGGNITLLTFTSDGKHLVSRGSDAVRVWDAATGKEVRRLGQVETENGGRTLDLSADGKWAAVASRGEVRGGGHIDLWSVETGNKAGSLGERFYHLARFAPDGKLLAASFTLTSIELWDVSRQKKLRSWQAHSKQLWHIVFTSDARKLLTIATSGEVRLWETATGRKLHQFTPAPWESGVGVVPPLTALSPDGNFLAIALASAKEEPKPGQTIWKARIGLWDATTGKEVRQFVCSSRPEGAYFLPDFRALSFTPDGKRLLTTGPDTFVRFWDAATGEELRRLSFEAGPPSCPTLSPDGKSLAAVLWGGFVIGVVDLANGRARLPLAGHRMCVDAAALAPDGRTAVTGDLQGPILVWDVADCRLRRRLEGHTRGIRSLRIAPDGRALVSIGWDQTLRSWDLSTGAERWRLKLDPMQSAVADRFVSAEGKTYCIIADATARVRLLDAANGEERQHFQTPKKILELVLLPNGRSLAARSDDHKVRVWDVMTGHLLREHSLRQDLRVALSPDGRLLAVTDAPPRIIPIDVERKHFLALQDLTAGHDVYRLDDLPECGIFAFSPDGRMLAWSEFPSGALHVLETASGRERHRFAGHRGQILALAFSADGSKLLCGCSDTTALVWDLDANSERRLVAAAETQALWSDLAGEDAGRAYRAIHRFAASPSVMVPFMRKRLRPVADVDEKRLARLIADLDNDDFATREKAMAELQILGEKALPAYRKALNGKPSLESRRRMEALQAKAQRTWWDVSGERLRSLRAIEALELAGTPEARQTLQTLAAGAAGARLTEEAKAALKRLQR